MQASATTSPRGENSRGSRGSFVAVAGWWILLSLFAMAIWRGSLRS
ncbi:MAG: hypothetical protein H6825_03340 [Planctomycetes bacterium]|nr:hypothetical protein [Planctomycetota bacterium]